MQLRSNSTFPTDLGIYGKLCSLSTRSIIDDGHGPIRYIDAIATKQAPYRRDPCLFITDNVGITIGIFEHNVTKKVDWFRLSRSVRMRQSIGVHFRKSSAPH